HNALCYRQTVRTERRRTIGPLLLGNANLPYLWRSVSFVAVIRARFHDGTKVMSQLLGGGSTNKVPAVIDGVDAQVGPQDKCVWLRTIGVLAFRLVKNVDLLDDRPLLIRQEGPLRSQTGPKRSLDERWVHAHGHQFAVIHCHFVLKLHKLPHLLLIARAEEPSKKDEDQWIAVQEFQMCVKEAGLREVRESC